MIRSRIGPGALALLLTWIAGPSAQARPREPLPSPEEIAALPPDGGPRYNRLVHEVSPYLLQHATNPVDWFPWGDEAFEKARREGKAVFLSVGYSTCHWCHVMERESFVSEEVAKALARDFVAIKVDREERPDVDATYMRATHLLHGQGGWPNTLWLTPEKGPFYAATYLTRPRLLQVLGRLAAAWRERPEQVEAQAERIATAIARMGASAGGSGGQAQGPLDRALIQKGLETLRESFSPGKGGFGGPPNFPPHQTLDLLLHELGQRPEPKLREMITATLDGMARGGIHDHVGGGFHRYSTDAWWFLPHFEKMLYDNGLLLRSFTGAFLATGEPRYRDVAERIAGWVLRDMTGERGGFYSALDADSAGEEGKFYLWTPAQVEAVLGPERAGLFCQVYDITEKGNYRDEATGRRTGESIPHLRLPLAEAARARGVPVEQLREQAASDRAALQRARREREWPGVDDKVLTAWNGYMIRGLAFAGRHLERPRFTAAAQRAADFLLEEMRQDGRLLRSYRAGQARLAGYLDDHAALALALLELHEATGEARWLQEAKALTETILADFRDREEGGFFFTAEHHEALLTRRRDPTDGAEPSGQGLATQLLVWLADLTGEERYRREARRALEAYRPSMAGDPRGAQSLLLALARFLDLPSSELGEPTAVMLRVPPLDLRLRARQQEVVAGGTTPVELELTIDEGWHVNSTSPAQEELVATTLRVAAGSPATLEELRYPPALERQLSFVSEPLSLYEGRSRIEAAVRIPSGIPPGPFELHLVLRAQACDDRRCLPPTDHDLRLPLRVTGGEEP